MGSRAARERQKTRNEDPPGRVSRFVIAMLLLRGSSEDPPVSGRSNRRLIKDLPAWSVCAVADSGSPLVLLAGIQLLAKVSDRLLV